MRVVQGKQTECVALMSHTKVLSLQQSYRLFVSLKVPPCSHYTVLVLPSFLPSTPQRATNCRATWHASSTTGVCGQYS